MITYYNVVRSNQNFSLQKQIVQLVHQECRIDLSFLKWAKSPWNGEKLPILTSVINRQTSHR
jgi:hypothetical protein